jgi:hypothetical protein
MPAGGTSPSVIASPLAIRSSPLQEAVSEEVQNESIELPGDESDHTGRKHALDPRMRSRADVFVLAEANVAALVSLPSSFVADLGIL